MSTTFQIGLAVSGAVVLAVVVGHGAWTSRKSRPKQATPEASGTPHSGPAPAQRPGSLEERHEPAFDLTGAGVADQADESGTPVDNASTGFGALPALEKKVGLDPLIDVIAPISIEAVVSGEAALAAMPATRRVGSKPFAVEGLSTESGQWEVPAPGQRYSALQASVQLANRTGALNQIEYSEFVIKAQAFADTVGGEPEFPEMQEEVLRARELDQFAGEHDAQLSFTLRALNTAWSPGYVQQSAARLGFVAGAIPGRMVLPSSQVGQAPLLGLSFDTQAAMAEDPEQTALRELTLSLDVPQVPRSERPFARLCETALSLAASMEGRITDDNGNPIRAEAMDVIHTDLEQLYDTLDARDLSAGSALGRRLFS